MCICHLLTAGNNEFSNMVREMESHSKKSQIHHSTPTGGPHPSTPSSSFSTTSATPPTPSSSSKPPTKHQVLRYSQQSISKQRENDSREAASRGVVMSSMDQAIGALSKLSLSSDSAQVGPDTRLPFDPYDAPESTSSHSGVPMEGSPSMTLKSLLQIEEQYPQGPPPGLLPSYYMYGSPRQPLLPTPHPYHHGPQPPLRGDLFNVAV